MRFFYSFFIRVYFALIWIASFFNPKAKLWINGRRDWRKQIPDNLKACIWIHASSLGEFEQGRPIIEKIKSNYPHQKIVLSFFSPSGFEIRKNYNKVDYVLYLPIDTIHNANRFVNIIQPQLAVFIKYEFWFNFIKVLNDRKIPIYLVSAIFRSNQHFFQWYGGWFRKHLKMFNHLFLQDQNSSELLKHFGFDNVTLAGDTRFDRVYENSIETIEFAEISTFINKRFCLIAGSSWEFDEILLNKILQQFPEIVMIIAPHEVHENHILKIENLLSDFKTIRFSALSSSDFTNSKVLIIDSIGKLMHLYKYADVAYIGGGFGAGIHNILEAATFGKPVFFGPNYHKFNEAKELIALGGAFSISEPLEFFAYIQKMIHDSEFKSRCGRIAKEYVQNSCGATEIILNSLVKQKILRKESCSN